MDLMFLTKYDGIENPNFYTIKEMVIFCIVEINSRYGYCKLLWNDI
jgi:hypothetical protein